MFYYNLEHFYEFQLVFFNCFKYAKYYLFSLTEEGHRSDRNVLKTSQTILTRVNSY